MSKYRHVSIARHAVILSWFCHFRIKIDFIYNVIGKENSYLLCLYLEKNFVKNNLQRNHLVVWVYQMQHD